MTGAGSPVERFYGRRAALYDVLARHTPGVGRWRTDAVAALELPAGGTVLDLGCGTGASLPYLRRAVGPAGRVVGVDRTPELLARARRRAARWDNVEVCRGDATEPPVDGPVDGILGAFVVGLLPDPAAAVRRWRRLAGADGRVALLDGVPTGWAHPVDRLFGTFVRLGAPPEGRTAVLARLTRSVETAHGLLRVTGSDPVDTEHALGLVRVTAAGGTTAARGVARPG